MRRARALALAGVIVTVGCVAAAAPALAPAGARAPASPPADPPVARARGAPAAPASAPGQPGVGVASAPVKPSQPPLSPADCDRAYDHVMDLATVGLARDDAAEARRNLELNRASFDHGCLAGESAGTVACILAAGELDEVALCGVRRAAGTPASTSVGTRPATRAECERAYAHLAELVLAELPRDAPPDVVARAKASVEAHRAEIVRTCIEDASLDTVRCVLGARSLPEADRCGR